MTWFFYLPEQIVTLLKSFPSPILLFLFLVTPFLIKWSIHKNPKTRQDLPPSPPKLPVIGNLHQLGPYPHRSLYKLSQRYGPIMFLSLGNAPAVAISSPDGAREIMQTHDLSCVNRPEYKIYKKLQLSMHDVATAPYGEYWRQLKSICTLQLLGKKRVLSFRTVREEEISIVMDMIKHQYYNSSKPVNLSEIFALISNNVLCRAAFGRKYDGEEKGKKLRGLLMDFFALVGMANIEDFLPWLSWINHINGRNAMVDRVAKEFDDFLEGMVEERLDHLEKQIPRGGDHEELSGEDTGEIFIDILLRIHKDKKAPNSLSRNSVKAIIWDMLAGGTDTTSIVGEWAMTELLRHPRIMKKLQDEVRGISKGKQEVKEDDLENMHYLKALIKETLRFYPPSPMIFPRKSTQDIKVMGYDIPRGSTIFINVWAIARDPSIWDDPEEFKPERFLNSTIDYKGQDFEFTPFGSGRRGCPGISFAMVIIELALANIVNKFNWKLPNGVKGDDLDMTECTGLTIRRKVQLLAIPTDPSSFK